MSGLASVNVDMRVSLTIVGVFMHVDMASVCAAESPDADAQQDNANETFSPGGKGIQWQHAAQCDGKQSNDQHAGGVAKSPPHARGPGTAAGIKRQWGDCGEMVWSGEDMNDSCGEGAGDDRDHDCLSGFRC